MIDDALQFLCRAVDILKLAPVILLLFAAPQADAAGDPATKSPAAKQAACPDTNTGITLAPGFCATVFADNLGHARHLVVSGAGVVYVNTWSNSDYYPDKPPLTRPFLVALRDTTGQGRADVIQRFGDAAAQKSAGGTGISFYKDAVYAEVNDRIVRYSVPEGSIVPTGAATTVVSGLPLGGDHPMHPFVIDSEGNLFVDVGTSTNSCQLKNRMPHSVGHSPCTELRTRGGIWRYDANKVAQRFSPAERFATGIRNGEGMAFDSTGRLFVTQHGRDQLSDNWPKLYKPAEGPELPAEEVVQLQSGGDYGWPTCYFDGYQKRLVLAPEYGGDGGKAVAPCDRKIPPVAFFPAHWAPNDLLIYSGSRFPAPYRGGFFIAFHGSWNRSPSPQGGYNVVYQPVANGHPSGDYIVFADGFAGAKKDPEAATFRPSGLAMGPDGALYISDDQRGRIWRVVYQATRPATQIAPAPPPSEMPSTLGGAQAPTSTPSLPIPKGATAEQVALGDKIFHGASSGGTCSGCHGGDGRGSSVGSNLTSGIWLWGDGSLRAISATVRVGVATPKHHTGAMPPKGGADLSAADVAAVSAYVWAIGHRAH
jgi:glucose/arabinose dehydrogenase